ncbi:MAG: TSUP family transporter [Myxococcaceae bacterium]|nr:TSUP family transporter [Myxococcaceae bacterium]
MNAPVTPLEIGLLAGAAFVAGVVDAIAGGGGLLTVPALLAVGLPPHLALGTNKGQSVFGSTSSLLRFHRAKLVSLRRGKVTFPLALAGSFFGAALVLWIHPATLRPIVLVLLVAVAIFLAVYRRPEGPPPDRHPLHTAAIAGGLAFVIGAYDGFFGPGTGTFLIAGFVGLLGLSLPEATADAKMVNVASNLAAVTLFAVRGVVLWHIALPMAAAQALGSFLGAHLAVRGGAKLIRPVVTLVAVLLSIKVAVDLYGAG